MNAKLDMTAAPPETTPPLNDDEVATATTTGGPSPTKENGTTSTTAPSPPEEQVGLTFFHIMAKYPWPFLVAIPIFFGFLVLFGWTQPNRIEDDVTKLWIATKNEYARDRQYARSLGMLDLDVTNFIAMAKSRDGKNLLTQERLDEIRARMETTETTTVVEYEGNVYTWNDVCYGTAPAAAYKFPCARLSPMDLFEEARWYFTPPERSVWYENVVKNFLVRPLLPRYGAMMQPECQDACHFWFTFRNNPEALGYPKELKNPLALFGDLQTMEYNDPCRICVEQQYTVTIETWSQNVPKQLATLKEQLVLRQEQLSGQQQAGDGTDDASRMQNTSDKIQDMITKLDQVLQDNLITTDALVDFWAYYVLRGLYIELGGGGVGQYYAAFKPLIEACYDSQTQLGLLCPPHPDTVTVEVAKGFMEQHADGAFSPYVSSGSPFPFWSKQDGTGRWFGYNEEERLYTVSGSGVNMSAPLDSLETYLQNVQDGTIAAIDVTSEEWQSQVLTNPLLAWFVAGVTKAPNGTKCANGMLPATRSVTQMNEGTQLAAEQMTQKWCNNYTIPNEYNPGLGYNGMYSVQHFARMWYDLLIGSIAFLNLQQGEDDPYTWTTGRGCGYTMGGSRYSYTNASTPDILVNASRLIYSIDEGSVIGPVPRNLLIGGAIPPIGEYSYENPLQQITVMQTFYPTLIAEEFVKRLQNCNRPGGPINITVEQAKDILWLWKSAMETVWTQGWDDADNGDIQFLGVYDDVSVGGSSARMLQAITMDSTVLMIVSIILITVFSTVFLFSFDIIDSRIVITWIGVALVILSFFAAMGFGLLLGIKVNVTSAWTLPFVMIGLGVDNIYIILLAIKKQAGYSERHWHTAMKEVIIPITMTSVVNACMYLVLNISDIPAVYLSSQVACYCIIFLYVAVIFCFPAYCYLDLKRQEQNRMDVFLCVTKADDNVEMPHHASAEDIRDKVLYQDFYKPLMLNDNPMIRVVVHTLVMLISIVLFVVGAWGITKRQVGVGVQTFFPENNPSHWWGVVSSEEVAGWSVQVNWGAVNYTDPITQMRIIKQFENVMSTPHVAQVDTKQLWLAQFAIWTSRHCTENFFRGEFDTLRCGHDQPFAPEGPDSYCAGSWEVNQFNLREKLFANVTDSSCKPFEGGICRPGREMHELDLQELGLDAVSAQGMSFCPVIKGWSDNKWQYCLRQWRNMTNSTTRFVFVEGTATPTHCDGVYYSDEELVWPMPYSSSPTLFAFDLFTHEDTLVAMRETRAMCDEDDSVRCWMSGPPYDYWSQYENIFETLVEISAYSAVMGFGISFIFLTGIFIHDKHYSMAKILSSSAVGASIIFICIVLTLIPVIGFSMLADISLTAFSNMSFVMSVGFVVEYSVHIIARWMRADLSHATSADRIEFTMSFLMMPTFLSFVSSTIGVICLAFTQFEFNRIFFFRPLIIVMGISYWYGCWFLPVLLSYLDFELLKMGKPLSLMESENISPPKETAHKMMESSDGSTDGNHQNNEVQKHEIESPFEPDVARTGTEDKDLFAAAPTTTTSTTEPAAVPESAVEMPVAIAIPLGDAADSSANAVPPAATTTATSPDESAPLHMLVPLSSPTPPPAAVTSNPQEDGEAVQTPLPEPVSVPVEHSPPSTTTMTTEQVVAPETPPEPVSLSVEHSLPSTTTTMTEQVVSNATPAAATEPVVLADPDATDMPPAVVDSTNHVAETTHDRRGASTLHPDPPVEEPAATEPFEEETEPVMTTAGGNDNLDMENTTDATAEEAVSPSSSTEVDNKNDVDDDEPVEEPSVPLPPVVAAATPNPARKADRSPASRPDP